MRADDEVAGRFLVAERLGAGGMGVVYRARDRRLGRDVALKALPADVASDPDRRRRFEHEARAAAALNHPNILALHDVGDHDGVPYLVTELLEGETLRSRISAGPLPVPEAVALAIQIARGLAAAHARGVVHRDLKPENLFLTRDGTVKILDFGLASLRPGAPADGALTEAPTETLTRAGTVIGTVGYMAPEQVRGQPVDQRADIFAFGCVLYEMLTGRRAFAGDTAADTLSAILREEPAAVEAHGSGVAPSLGELVRRCLEKRPENRFSSAHDLALALGAAVSDTDSELARSVAASPPRRLPTVLLAVAGAALLVAAVAGVLLLRRDARSGTPAAALDPARVMVAPFENLTGDSALESVGAMTADAIVEGLQQLGGLDVLRVDGSGRTATAERGAQGWSDVARSRGAAILVTGSVYLAGETLELRSRITDVGSDELLYALDPDVGPIAASRDVVAANRDRVMGAVAYHRSPILGMLTEPLAYRAFREFYAGMEASGIDWKAAASHFQQAVELEPDCWMAQIRLAIALRFTGEPERAERLWAEIVRRKAELSTVELLWVKYDEARRRGNVIEALGHARQLHRLTPRDEAMAAFAAITALSLNRPRETLELLGDPHDFDWSRWARVPQGEWLLSCYAAAHHLLGEYDAELEVGMLATRLYPGSPRGFEHRARALAALGRIDELEAVVEDALALPSGASSAGTVLYQAAAALRRHGHPAEAIDMADRGISWYAAHPAEQGEGREDVPWARFDAEAVLLWLAGRNDEARQLGEAWSAAFPESLSPPGYLGAVAARCGDDDTVTRVLAELEAVQGPAMSRRNALYWRAVITAQRGEIRDAFELLREAVASGYPVGMDIHQHLLLEPLAGYPPFEELVEPEG